MPSFLTKSDGIKVEVARLFAKAIKEKIKNY